MKCLPLLAGRELTETQSTKVKKGDAGRTNQGGAEQLNKEKWNQRKNVQSKAGRRN